MAYYTLTSDSNCGTLTLEARSPEHAIARAVDEMGWNDFGTFEVAPYLPGVHEIRPVELRKDW